MTTRENRRIAFGGGRRRVGDRSSVACEYSLLQCLMYTSHDVTYDMIRSASRLFLQVRERPFLYPLFVIRKVRVRRGFVHQRAEIVQRVDVVVQVVDVVRDVPELRVHLLQAPLEHLAHACEEGRGMGRGVVARSRSVRSSSARVPDVYSSLRSRGAAGRARRPEGSARAPSMARLTFS